MFVIIIASHNETKEQQRQTARRIKKWDQQVISQQKEKLKQECVQCRSRHFPEHGQQSTQNGRELTVALRKYNQSKRGSVVY